MRVWQSVLSSAVICWFFLGQPMAATSGVSVESVEVQKSASEDWTLNARLRFQLSPLANDALQHGIPLLWHIRIKWQRPRPFIWDKLLFQTELPVRLQYHALLNQYSVWRGKSGKAEMFASLSAALNDMAYVRDVRLPVATVETPAKNDYIAIKVFFEREALPVPLRPRAWFDSQWSLSSDEVICPFQP